MSEQISTLVKSHLNTSNVYVKRNIITENIKAINAFITSTPRQNVSNDVYFKITEAKRKQVQHLKNITLEINDIEQTAFQFGSPFLPNH